MAERVIVETDLPGLKQVSRGKVRDMYEVEGNLLIVASDRISAYDSILPTGIPQKGKVLTGLTLFWLDYLKPDYQLITANVAEMPDAVRAHADILRGRSMLVKNADVLPVECVARGYLAGSGWREYQESGTVCGIELPAGLRESEKLPRPAFTPATKAETGHDENISLEKAAEIIGTEKAETIRRNTLELYSRAADYARTKGIIICDTKFEWGVCDGEVVLIDEVLTPDSSRFWPLAGYEPGKSQPSFDKQYVRDWLTESGWDREPPAPELPEEVARKTSEKYVQAYEILTGGKLAE